jgi:CheY-like chemotaxis protein
MQGDRPAESDPDGEPAVVLVFAPGGDGELACSVLQESGHRCQLCRDENDLHEQLRDDVGALLLAEEVLSPRLAAWLQERLHHQAPWSNLPVIVMARPMAPGALAAAVGSALGARAQQFQVRRVSDLAPPAHRRPAGTQKLHVLLAEDNEDAAETLRLLLEFSGHEVRVASSGPEAVAAARERAPDALLCDIGLPGMSGYEVARVLRAEPALAHTLFMALTGYGTTGDRTAALAAGFDLHLAKPVDPDQVFRELERHARRA